MEPVRKKILLLIPTMMGGGAERFFSILARHLDRASFEIHLGLLQARGEYMREIPADVIIHDLNVTQARYSITSMIRLIRRLRPHAVLSTLPQMNIALTCTSPFVSRSTKLLIGEAAMTSFALRDGKNQFLWTRLYRFFYKRAHKVICLCDAMVEDMATNFKVPREKLTRIYYPVDITAVRKSAESEGNPYTGQGPQIAAVGRLCRQKGFDLLLEAMPAVRTRFPGVQLSILGQGPLLENLQEQTRRLELTETVHFLGFQPNPWRYIRHAGLFVLPSRYEGLPNILLEALALDTRVVATDCPSAIREVRAESDLITLVPPEDPRALADAIVHQMLNQSVGNGKQIPFRNDLSKFDLRQVVQMYSDLLQ